MSSEGPAMTTATPAGLPRSRLLAIVLFAAIVPCVLMAAPAIATQYALQLGLGPAQIGQLFSAELAAMSLATLPAYLWQPRLDWRLVARGAALLFIVANLASAWVSAFHPLMVLRVVSALAGGTLMVLCIASAAQSQDRDRVYGLWVMGQLVLGAIGLWLLPPLFARFGLQALYLGLALLMLLCLPLAGSFQAMAASTRAPVRERGGLGWRALLALFAVLAFYVGLSGVWTFIGSIASAAAIDPASSGRILAIATLLGIAGAACAALIGRRWPRGAMLLLGYGLMAGAVLLLLDQPGLARFATAALVFKYTWTFALPFILACLADLDRDGRLMNTTNLLIGGGLALGPAIAGPLLESSAGMRGVLLLSATCLLLSFAALSASRLRAGEPTPSLDDNGVQP
ncbi:MULTISPECIES: MFS transporter [unclassified Pseudomonas]|uniref:MFS transporter n=1 Tax=unclassified Pseudomonas TaxID=196821 RepID=UPI000DA9E1DF|nr:MULTISPECIES: MFS transporter [unclassified Pseudomonas]MDW3711266.1 MFS transporter [Pseudomonas sp. 2023EL-01195]PZE09904.1 MFS transporter [Pseudomonas sp. 57B-090624]